MDDKQPQQPAPRSTDAIFADLRALAQSDGALHQISEIIYRDWIVTVSYGEFLIVVQAKSKRVTLKARAGDTEALRTDFDGAIQAPYRQALRCIELIGTGVECAAKDGKILALHPLPRFFPAVILGDPFPGSTFL